MEHHHYLFSVLLKLTLSAIYMTLVAHKCVMWTSKYVVMKYNLPESSIISDKKIVYSEYNWKAIVYRSEQLRLIGIVYDTVLKKPGAVWSFVYKNHSLPEWYPCREWFEYVFVSLLAFYFWCAATQLRALTKACSQGVASSLSLSAG